MPESSVVEYFRKTYKDQKMQKDNKIKKIGRLVFAAQIVGSLLMFGMFSLLQFLTNSLCVGNIISLIFSMIGAWILGLALIRIQKIVRAYHK